MRTLIFVALAAIVMSLPAKAAPVQRLFQDVKLPSQAVLEHQTIVTPVVASTTRLQGLTAANTSATTTYTTFTLQPDVARVITITTGGTTANVGAGNAVVTGTDIAGKALTENIAISSTQAGTSTGVKAFKTVSSIVFPATTGAGVTVAAGVGSALGLKRCMANAGSYVFSVFNGAYEATRGTAVANATVMAQNVFTPNGTMDGAKNVEVYFVQNYGCF